MAETTENLRLQCSRTQDMVGNTVEIGAAPLLRHTQSTISMRTRREIEQDPEIDIDDWKSRGSDEFQNVITALYCKLLVILGIAFPMAETLTTEIRSGFYRLFYIYLFVGSLLFLVYVYCDLWRFKAVQVRRFAHKKTSWLKSVQNRLPFLNRKQSSVRTGNGTAENGDVVDNQKADDDDMIPRPKNVYGSLYLRLGAVMFGIGSMIHSGIEVGLFFETSMGTESEKCQNMLATGRPFLQIIFVFVQMYFIFLNQKMNVYKNKFASRFGLMHMIATNLCVWINVLIMETKHEVLHYQDLYNEEITVNVNNDIDLHSNQTEDKPVAEHLVSYVLQACSTQRNVMGRLLSNSSPFLFPCTIEYSLICAAILYTMWSCIEDEHEHYNKEIARIKNGGTFKVSRRVTEQGNELDQQEYSERHLRHLYSVDCSRANNGLFCGILVIVLTVISLIVFFVLMGSKEAENRELAIMVASLTELLLYSLSTVAVIIGMIQVRKLWYDRSKKLELDNLLLVVAQTGVLMYSVFCIIGAYFQMTDHLIAFLASLATLVQTLLQTLFILDASDRFAYCAEQVKHKPGREVVTFLLVCNLAMWAINTLETNRADSHPIQVDFYGGQWVWPIITHVSMPLAIFYRFHSTVCLCEIWSKSFRYKDA